MQNPCTEHLIVEINTLGPLFTRWAVGDGVLRSYSRIVSKKNNISFFSCLQVIDL
jgi:hypothetical protein